MSRQDCSRYSIKKVLLGEATVGESVHVAGWVKTRRDSKAGLSFITLHDGSCFQGLQIVVPKALSNYAEEILSLTAGCSIEVTGELVDSPAKGQVFEVQATLVRVVGWVEDPDTYPISPKHHTLEYLREYAHLRPRTNVIGAVTRIRHCLSQAIHRFFHEREFYWIHTPIITASDCEGAGEMFRVSMLDVMHLPRDEHGNIDFSQDFFGKEAFLTVSGQLNVEAYCLAMSKVYTFGPTFRAENSNTSRHLAEFWMIEPEIAFADLSEVADLSEALLKYLSQVVLEERSDDMDFFMQRIDKECIRRLEHIIEHDFIRMEYTEVIDKLQSSDKRFEYPVRWGLDLQSEHERYLTEELIGRPVTVVNYPKDIKAFYMRQNEDNKTVAAMDVLVPGIGEIIGGSQREERIDLLEKRMDESGVDKKGYRWYLDLRRYGSVPHGGFGLGFERLLCYVTGMANIRDVIPFPRTARHAEF